jgi:hypothetical protein
VFEDEFADELIRFAEEHARDLEQQLAEARAERDRLREKLVEATNSDDRDAEVMRSNRAARIAEGARRALAKELVETREQLRVAVEEAVREERRRCENVAGYFDEKFIARQIRDGTEEAVARALARVKEGGDDC